MWCKCCVIMFLQGNQVSQLKYGFLLCLKTKEKCLRIHIKKIILQAKMSYILVGWYRVQQEIKGTF